MSVCILPQDGASLVHRPMQAAPEPWLRAMAPSRDGLVVAGACLFPWSWWAALGAAAGLPFVLGPARSMKAIPGGTAKNDKSASHKIAVRLRGGMLPLART
jgi:hypothetical protein